MLDYVGFYKTDFSKSSDCAISATDIDAELRKHKVQITAYGK